MHTDSTDKTTPHEQMLTTLLIAEGLGAFREATTTVSHLTGADILAAAGRPSSPDQIVFQLFAAGGGANIRLGEPVSLRAGRKFVISAGDRTFRFTLDGGQFEWPHGRICELMVRELAQVPLNREIELVHEGGVTVLGPESEINLEGAGVETMVTKLRAWELRVQGVPLIYDHSEVVVGEAMKRAGFDPEKAWHIYLIVQGQPKQEVTVNYKVDLRTPGIEKIRLMQRNVDNGEGATMSVRRAFKLLDADHEYLDGLGSRWESVMVGARRWLLLHDYQVMRGYAPSKTVLALDVPVNYPASQIDMFYFAPWVVRADGVEVPSVQVRETIDGVVFQGWSRHRNSVAPWDPVADNVRTHLALVETCLSKELGE